MASCIKCGGNGHILVFGNVANKQILLRRDKCSRCDGSGRDPEH